MAAHVIGEIMPVPFSDQEIEFTEDMAETLVKYFGSFAVDGVVTILKDERGLWLVTEEKRAFLGLARLPATSGRRLN